MLILALNVHMYVWWRMGSREYKTQRDSLRMVEEGLGRGVWGAIANMWHESREGVTRSGKVQRGQEGAWGGKRTNTSNHCSEIKPDQPRSLPLSLPKHFCLSTVSEIPRGPDEHWCRNCSLVWPSWSLEVKSQTTDYHQTRKCKRHTL